MASAVSWCVIDWDEAGADTFPSGVILRDASGEIIRVTLGPGDTDCRPFYKASRDDWIVKAIVVSEDGTFFEHSGIRPLSMLRAAWQNIMCRRRISGASTITMQTVRLIKPHRKTYVQKWIESFRAMKMERKKDKLWILSQYLNRAPFGANLVGVEAAANGWFGKKAKDLTLCEAALLAGMVQAPSRFRLDRRYSRALKRRDYVLDRMLELGVATGEQVEASRGVHPKIVRNSRPFLYPHYCDWYLRWIAEEKAVTNVTGDITTSLESRIQARAQSIVDRAHKENGIDASIIVRRNRTGEVIALAVSGNYFSTNAGQVNTALAARSAGSTLKPLLAALAMDSGIVAPSERLADIPRTYKGYTPANFDSKWRGLVPLDEALVLSLNVPFVHMLERTGVERFGSMLRTIGFKRMGGDDSARGLGMAIGNVEVTLEELTGAYARFARAANGERDLAFSRESAYIVSQALSSPQRSLVSLGHIADVQLPRFAWKTGTSSAYRDAWTVAWNPEFTIGVWCGHISGKIGSKTLVGAQKAAPLAWEMIRALYPGNVAKWFARPEGVCARKVCSLSGLLPGADCPNVEEGLSIHNVTPPRLCSMHRRDIEGNVIEVLPPALAAFMNRVEKARNIVMVKPVDGSLYTLVPGMAQQKIVCKVSGNPHGEKLWWYCDGKIVGQTAGTENFVMEMIPGKHRIVCTTAEGVTTSAEIEVKAQ